MNTYDVAVIGGGIAGVSVAFELSQDRSVVVLEQEDQLGVHTTGRSAAMYFPNYGNATVRALTRASRGDFDRLVRDLGGPPLLSPRAVLYVSDEDTEAAREVLTAGGGRLIDEAHIRALCSVIAPDRLAWAAVADGMDIDVMALHAAYVRGLWRRRGEVRRSAPVHALERDGDRWRIACGDGEITARVVVNAAGAWADIVAELAGIVPIGLRPLRRTMFTSPIEADTATDVATWPLVIDAQERFYFKPDGPQVMASPADETPVEPGDYRIDELDIARTIEAVNGVTTLGLRRVTAQWSGLRTFAPDRSPVVGEADGAPGFVWFCGQGGYGIQMAPALARVGAAVIGDEPIPADVLAEGLDDRSLQPHRFLDR